MWKLNHKEVWKPKKWRFPTVVLEKTLVNPLDSKDIKPVNPKGNQPWMFIGRTDAEAEAPILWSSDSKSQFIGKGPDAGKDWGQEEKWSQRMSWLDGIIKSMDMSLSKLREIGSPSWRTGWWRTGVLQSMGWETVGHDWVIELNAYTRNLERW